MVQDFLKALLEGEFRDILVHHQIIPEFLPQYLEPSHPLTKPLRDALRKIGILKLYSHQHHALELVRAGKNPVIVTPTASGKTLSYNIPILEYFLSGKEGYALYVFPLKALEQDQLKQLRGLVENITTPQQLSAAIYDGDTTASMRAKIKAHFPRILLTNPEMLHMALSGYHRGWDKFFQNLKFIIIDELHTYKGIFGSHMAQVFRRVDRLCRYYGSTPQYIASSATIANPAELAENLTGKPFVLVDKSGAPMAKRHYVFLNPEISVYTVASRLFRLGIEMGMKTIVFTKARKITELIYQWVLEAQPELEQRISAYRAGFLPQERREIEAKLNSGELWGVISTSALELGVDIGSLDLCILVGYPGTICSTFQRGGRVGRKAESVVVLLAQQNALDQYFMHQPEDFFGRPVEAAVVDKENSYILREHLLCAAAELPLIRSDLYYSPEKYPDLVSKLEKEGALQRSADGERWFSTKRNPQLDVDLRAAGAIYTITDNEGQNIGSIGGANVYSECHPGAVYLHMGRQYLVMELDIPHKNVTVKPAEVPYYTVARSQKDTQIINKRKSRKFHNFVLHLGELKVTEWITGYEKRKFHTQELMGTFPLDLPEQSYETVGLWMEIPREARSYCEDKFLHFMGGLHGTEHALLSLVPLFAICDRGDMGGISMVEHVGVKGPAVFLYDGYPGGIGLAERIFGIFENLLERTLKLVEECPCDDGCPSCIHSPKCGSGNYPLNKETVVELMKRFCGNGDFSLPEPVESAKTILKSKPNEPAEKVGIFAKEPTATKTKAETKTGPILVFDLETQLSAEDVGGWGNIEKMRLAVGVTLDIATNKVRIYYEEDAQNLIQALQQAELVIGFNLHRFDYAVLKPYGLEHPFQIRTLDILKHIEEVLGHRLSLDVLCEATLETKKSADGLQSIEWFKQGKLDLVAEYCQNDVKLTRDLYLFGKNNGYILYNHKQHGSTRIPVKW